MQTSHSGTILDWYNYFFYRSKRLCLLLILLQVLSFSANQVSAAPDDDYFLAIGLYKRQRWQLAAESFEKFIQQNPKHERVPSARFYWGLTLVNLEKYAQARSILKDYVQAYPRSRNVPDAQYRIGECSYLLEDLKSAVLELHSFVKNNPKHDLTEWALPYLADAELRTGKTREAQRHFQQALEQFPQSRLHRDSQYGLARAYEKSGQGSKALPLYKQLAGDKNFRRADLAQLKLGAIAFDQKDYTNAIQYYQNLERRFPQSKMVPIAQLNSGYALYQSGQFREAIQQFDAAGKQADQAAAAGYWKGIATKQLKEYPQASQILEQTYRAHSQDPLAPSMLYQWAECETEQNHFEQARKIYEQVTARWPMHDLADDSQYQAAQAAFLSGNTKDATALLDQFQKKYARSSLMKHHDLLRGQLLEARGEAPNLRAAARKYQDVLNTSNVQQTQLLARYHLARVWQKLDEHQRVLTTIAPLIQEMNKEGEQTKFADALVLYGHSNFAKQDYNKANQAMRKYLDWRPDGEFADQALAVIARSESHLGKYEQANQSLVALSQRYPKSALRASTIHRLAEHAYDAKQWKWSSQWFSQLEQLGMDNPLHVVGLSGSAWSAYQAGQYKQAAKLFQQVVVEHGDNQKLAPEAAFMRAQSLEEDDQHPAAISAYQQTLNKYVPGPFQQQLQAKSPADYGYRAGLQAARLLRKMNKTDDADKAYQKIAERFPNIANKDKLLDEWALLHYEAGDYDKADSLFRRLIKETPNSDLADNALLSLAESDLITQKFDSAEKSLRQLISNDHSDELVQQVARSHLVGLAVEKQDWQQVLQDAKALLKQFPQSQYRWQTLLYQGEALLNQDKPKEALTPLQELKQKQADASIRKQDWFPRVWVLLTETYFRLKEYKQVDETVAAFQQWDSKSPFLYQAEEILGRSYIRRAKFDEARAAFQRAIDNPHASRTETAAKCQFQIGESFINQNQYDKALPEYLKVYHLYEYPEWQAAALFQAGQCDEARKQVNKAVQSYQDLLKEFPNSEVAPKARTRLKALGRSAAR